MSNPRIVIVSPALASANNGNWHTAARWRSFLSGRAQVDIQLDWDGEPTQALIALHARRSADSIARFTEQHPDRPLALVLTGTDLYRDIDSNPMSRQSLKRSSHLVVLQDEGLHRLSDSERMKARVIVQSATRLVRPDQSSSTCDFVAVGHLREEKDPLTLMQAARRWRGGERMRIIHIGSALTPELGEAARQIMHECSHYQWLGALPQLQARRWIARSSALVHMSRMEGGANVVIEAVRSRVPVLASRIDGNVGLLGRDYDGYFPVGDADALAELMKRFSEDQDFAQHLTAQCAAREHRFVPAAEAKAVRKLVVDMLAGRDHPGPQR